MADVLGAGAAGAFLDHVLDGVALGEGIVVGRIQPGAVEDLQHATVFWQDVGVELLKPRLFTDLDQPLTMQSGLWLQKP